MIDPTPARRGKEAQPRQADEDPREARAELRQRHGHERVGRRVGNPLRAGRERRYRGIDRKTAQGGEGPASPDLERAEVLLEQVERGGAPGAHQHRHAARQRHLGEAGVVDVEQQRIRRRRRGTQGFAGLGRMREGSGIRPRPRVPPDTEICDPGIARIDPDARDLDRHGGAVVELPELAIGEAGEARVRIDRPEVDRAAFGRVLFRCGAVRPGRRTIVQAHGPCSTAESPARCFPIPGGIGRAPPPRRAPWFGVLLRGCRSSCESEARAASGHPSGNRRRRPGMAMRSGPSIGWSQW